MDITTHLLAILLHESGRAPVAAGQTLAHAVQSPQTRPFVEWPDLPAEVQQGRRLTAANLLARFNVEADSFPVPGDQAFSVDMLAAEIHAAVREAVDRGLVLVKLNRPWVEFADLPEQAQEGRRRQARYLLARAWWWPKT